MKTYKVIGLMSGTSLDGVDAAYLETDGEGYVRPGPFVSIPYEDSLRERIRASFGKTEAADVARELTLAHAEAVRKLDVQADLIGFHGQTISHDPAHGLTCQIGDGALLAKLTGIPVVNDFRTADVKAGGQGAPLVPVYHQALAGGVGLPAVFLNIGGVANVTYVGDELLAFDTGPGNALIDDWMLYHTGKKFDDGGKLAQSGEVNGAVLRHLLSHPYFKAKPPKSLDRNAFAVKLDLSAPDGAATLTAFTAQSIARAAEYFPAKPKKWVVAGGGRHNAHLMRLLQEILQTEIVFIDTLGFNGDATEAEAFGYLAVRSVKGLPLSFPGTTAVPKPMTGGTLNDI